MTRVLLTLLAISVTVLAPEASQAPARNVVIVTIDGYRWQEMFGGVDASYFQKDSQGRPGFMEKRFWRDTPEERRRTLTPFLWTEVATKGQIIGAPEANSRAHVTNGLWFSYPGYNEMFAGRPTRGLTVTTKSQTRTSRCSSG